MQCANTVIQQLTISVMISGVHRHFQWGGGDIINNNNTF